MATFITEQEALATLHFPLAGINVAAPLERSPSVQLSTGDYTKFTPLGVNVRGYTTATNRLRGGTRPGLSRYIPRPLDAGWIVQDINYVIGQGYSVPGGGVTQLSQSGRVVTLVAVSKGNVYVAQPGATSWVPAVNGTATHHADPVFAETPTAALPQLVPPLNFSGVIFSTSLNQKLWFADGINYVYYEASTNTLKRWLASAGTLPRDSENNAPRLICTYRGRMVLSGILGDPQNWFMSRVSDPTDWNFAPQFISPSMPVAGNNSPLGLVGDVITALVPYSDDIMLFGGDHTIWAMSGDPAAGGQIDLITDSCGIAWGEAWCKSPDGTLYFISNRTGVYALRPGSGPPQRISQAIEELLLDLDTGNLLFRMAWNDRYQGFHLFATPITAPGAATHFFWEQRTGAWWEDVFANDNLNPIACCVFDGNLPTDRAVLVGSWDGYVRRFDPDATTDDGTTVASEVILGPLLTADSDEVLLKDVQAILGTSNTGTVSYEILVGSSAEAALTSTAVASGTWSAGRNLTNLVRRSGHAIWVRLTASTPWAMEAIRCRVVARGKVRRRGY